MPKITKVYTRTGDDGTTSLGSGQRVQKDSLRVEASGAVDELNCAIGTALSKELTPAVERNLQGVQNDLFHLGCDLSMFEGATPLPAAPKIEQRHIDALEHTIDMMLKELKPLDNFILPGGCAGAAALHLARAVCRRSERRVITLRRHEPVDANIVKYLNRLSDALFVMARYENMMRAVTDVYWNSKV
ncbi:MAG: cob(I)yrinic acid a,c-diamide adenosyltransferase [Elusimicrobiota bacterium]